MASLRRPADRVVAMRSNPGPLAEVVTIDAARLLGWARVERGDLDLTDQGGRVGEASVAEPKVSFRDSARALTLLASILHALAAGEPVLREKVLAQLQAHVPPSEAERQVDTAVDWGRWADLFENDSDDACFLHAGEAGRR